MNDIERPPTQPTKVTLEDLLRLKRAERPPVEFWAEFEQQMRTKQLAAIVRKDPWWRSWRNVLASSARFHLPVGATAMLALAFITVREYRHSAPVETRLPDLASTLPAFQAEQAQPVSLREESHVAPEIAATDSESPLLPAASVAQSDVLARQTVVEVAQTTPASSAVQSSEEAGTPEMLGFSAGPNSVAKPTSSQSSRVIAANLVSALADEPDLLPVLARSRSFDSSLAEKSGSVEPLSQVTTPRDARRARLLASAVATDLHSPEHSPARSRERITSQLNDQSLYDSITRLGLAGNRLSIKF